MRLRRRFAVGRYEKAASLQGKIEQYVKTTKESLIILKLIPEFFNCFKHCHHSRVMNHDVFLYIIVLFYTLQLLAGQN